MACRLSTVAANDLMRAARSAVVGLPIVEVIEAVEDSSELGTAGDGAGAVGFSGGVVVEEERLEPDTWLSRALVPR